MDTLKKVEEIYSANARMIKDMERLSDYLDTLKEKRYNDSVSSCERRLLDVDQALADVSAIVAYLNIFITKMYSGEYTKELFECSNSLKSDVSLQATNLLSYCRTLAFMLNERSKTARAVYDNKVKDEEKNIR